MVSLKLIYVNKFWEEIRFPRTIGNRYDLIRDTRAEPLPLLHLTQTPLNYLITDRSGLDGQGLHLRCLQSKHHVFEVLTRLRQ